MKTSFIERMLLLLIWGLGTFGASAFADMPLSQTTDPNYRWAWNIIRQSNMMDLEVNALDPGQDPASRVGAGRPPHPSNSEGIRNLNRSTERFFESRFRAEVQKGPNGASLTRADKTLVALYKEAEALPQAQRAGAIDAGRKILGHLRTTLMADLDVTKTTSKYAEYYKANESNLKARFSELKNIKSDGTVRAPKPPLSERVQNAKTGTGTFIKETFTKDNATNFLNKSVNIGGIAAGMGAYFVAEHLALCWRQNDPDCFRIVADFSQTKKGFFILSSYVGLVVATRGLTNWGLRRAGFATDTQMAFWLSFGMTTLASPLIQSWFNGEYLPEYEKNKKEYAFVLKELDRVTAEISALEKSQPGEGGFKARDSLENLKKYQANLTKRRNELRDATSSRLALFWADADKRYSHMRWDRMAYEFIKTGVILSWIQKAKIGELSLNAMKPSAGKEGLKSFATAEREQLLNLLQKQTQQEIETEHAAFRATWNKLARSRVFNAFRLGLRYANVPGVQLARGYGYVAKGATGTVSAAAGVAGKVISYVLPQKWLGPLAGFYAAFYDKFGKFFMDSAAFAFVYSAMTSSVDWVGGKVSEAALYPTLYKNHLEIESAVDNFIKLGQTSEFSEQNVAETYLEFHGQLRDVIDTWQGYRAEVILKPLEKHLDSWGAWISAYSDERYMEREWMGFFARTAKMEPLQAYESDERFKANGRAEDRKEWHFDFAEWPGLLRDQREKYWNVYNARIRGKNINVESYLKDQEKLAQQELVAKQREKISKIGPSIDQVYMTGTTAHIMNGAAVMVDLIRSLKASNAGVPECEFPRTPGNLNSAYIEEIKYFRLLILSWVKKYPEAMESREIRDLYDGLRASPCNFGPFRSRLKMILENIADLDANIHVAGLILVPTVVKEKTIRWSVVARHFGSHLLAVLDQHEGNKLIRDRLYDVTWNFLDRQGQLEKLKGIAGKAMVVSELERRAFIDSLDANGFVFVDGKPKYPFRDEKEESRIQEGLSAVVAGREEVSDEIKINALKNSSTQEKIDSYSLEASIKACMESGASREECIDIIKSEVSK